MENEIDFLEKRKKTDMSIVDKEGAEWTATCNPIENLNYSSWGNSVQTVIIDGRILAEYRETKTIDKKNTCEFYGKEVKQEICYRKGGDSRNLKLQNDCVIKGKPVHLARMLERNFNLCNI